MTRTGRHKVRYVVLLVVVGGLVAALVGASGGHPLVWGLALVSLLAPGRIQGWLWRELFNGRTAFAQGRFEEALRHFEAFRRQLDERPSLKRARWLAGMIYTTDVGAMVRNNIGAAHLELGNVEAAERAFGEAATRDPLYPLPVYNLAVLAEVAGERAEAMRYAREAEALGYTRATVDRVIERASVLYARVESRTSDEGD